MEIDVLLVDTSKMGYKYKQLYSNQHINNFRNKKQILGKQPRLENLFKIQRNIK